MPSSSIRLHLAVGDLGYINHSLISCWGKADILTFIAPLPFCTRSSKSLRISLCLSLHILGLGCNFSNHEQNWFIYTESLFKAKNKNRHICKAYRDRRWVLSCMQGLAKCYIALKDLQKHLNSSEIKRNLKWKINLWKAEFIVWILFISVCFVQLSFTIRPINTKLPDKFMRPLWFLW